MRFIKEDHASSAGREVENSIELMRNSSFPSEDDSEDAHVPDHVMFSASWQVLDGEEGPDSQRHDPLQRLYRRRIH